MCIKFYNHPIERFKAFVRDIAVVDGHEII